MQDDPVGGLHAWEWPLPPGAPSRGLRGPFGASADELALESERDASEVRYKIPRREPTIGVVQGSSREQRIVEV